MDNLKVQPNILKGSFYALTGFFFMALFGILTKLALQNGSAIWISFIAYLTGTLLLSVYIIPQGFQYLKSEHYGYLISRAIFGTVASFLYTISMHYIPIVNGTLLFNTAPIFMPILAIFWLKKNVEKYIWFAVLLGFIGIIFIVRPTEAIFTQAGNLIGLLSGISLAIAYMLIKLLASSDTGVRIIFYYLGIGTLMQLPLLFFAGPLPSMDSCLFAILSGLVLVIAQLSIVKGYTYADATEVGIYQYSSVVFVGLINWMIWSEIPPFTDLIGVILVAIAGMIIIRHGVVHSLPRVR